MTTEDRIRKAAVELLEAHGPDGMTTRSVCERAGVTAPTLYHHFGDKNGLVRAIVTEGITEFMSMKRAMRVTADPLADLRRGWHGWIDFGLERPVLFRLMIDAARVDPTHLKASYEQMEENVRRLRDVHGLQVDLRVAVQSIWAAASGVQALFVQGAKQSEIRAAAKLLFDALVHAIAAR